MAGLSMTKLLLRSAPFVALALAGSVGLLGGAFAFQHIGGMAPCEMCIWQRWPHVLAIALGIAALAAPAWRARISWLGAATMAVSAGLALLHTGVERKWWEGITQCSVAQGDMSTDALLDAILAAPVVRCDQVAWQMGGLSMASWNGVISLFLLLYWVNAAVRARAGR
jgi:disulfide bond formation protein DsbB